jgi:nucleoside-diphosphate-sugar epimerase
LVLGAEHFIGATVCLALTASDWAVPVPLSGGRFNLSAELLNDVHAVFNGTMGRPGAVAGNARDLFGALDRAGMNARVVHLSSMTVYGSNCGEVAEDTPLRPDAGAYGAAQVAAESEANRYPRSVILRPGCEYGPGCPQWSERIARLLCSHRLGDLGAAGDGVCNLVFVDDLVGAILTALRAPGIDGQCFNLAMRSPPTWNDYLVLFARALGAVPVSRVSGRRLRMEAGLMAPPLKLLEFAARRLRGESRAVAPAITRSLVNLCRQDITLNSEKAERLLDVSWTPLREGLRQAAAACGCLQPIGNTSMRRNSIG